MAEYDVFTRINEHYAKMSKGHKAIADYISEHYDQAVFMTAAKLGETLGISESTVVRFAAGIGYDGYPRVEDEYLNSNSAEFHAHLGDLLEHRWSMLLVG